jgi:hypothetical protein
MTRFKSSLCAGALRGRAAGLAALDLLALREEALAAFGLAFAEFLAVFLLLAGLLAFFCATAWLLEGLFLRVRGVSPT